MPSNMDGSVAVLFSDVVPMRFVVVLEMNMPSSLNSPFAVTVLMLCGVDGKNEDSPTVNKFGLDSRANVNNVFLLIMCLLSLSLSVYHTA